MFSLEVSPTTCAICKVTPPPEKEEKKKETPAAVKEITNEFQRLIDDKMDIFLAREKCSRSVFMGICRDAVLAANRGEDGIGVVFVELLLASTEYESFCVMMAHEGKEQRDRRCTEE